MSAMLEPKLKEAQSMRSLDINELPQWSPWPARLLGAETFKELKRDIAKIEAEYNQDKYAACLDRYRQSNGALDPVALRFSVSGRSAEKEFAAVLNGKLVVARQADLIDALFALLPKAVIEAAPQSKTIVELGSAFGANLWKIAEMAPGKQFVGGDYSDNAIAIAQLLYSGRDDIRVEKLNFYDSRYPLFDRAEGPVTVFTSQAIEQLPTAEPFLNGLAAHKDKIAAVVQLEPAFDLHDSSLLGMMRRRYLELNDYNRDLLSGLKRRSDIEIVDVRKDVLGFNEYNSLSLIAWRYV